MSTVSVSAGVASSLIIASTTHFWGPSAPPVVQVTSDGSFLKYWEDIADDGSLCEFYNASFQYTGALCSHFAMSRMSQATQVDALNRALSCAAHHQTDCILSPEVGLSVPAAFVYDPEEGLKMIIAPKLLQLPDEYASDDKLIEFRDPNEKRHAQMHMESMVNVEYLRGGTRRMTTEIFNGTSAYCIQLLRLAFDSTCWAEIE